MNIEKLVGWYKEVRSIRRETIGWAVCGTIIGVLVAHATWTQLELKSVSTYTATVAHAEEAPKRVIIEVLINWDRARIDKEIEMRAEQYGVSADTLKRIVQCESGYVTDVQSHHILSYGRERSYGLAQLHLPSHPGITYEQAVNPAFAIEYLAKHYAEKTDKWSCK